MILGERQNHSDYNITVLYMISEIRIHVRSILHEEIRSL